MKTVPLHGAKAAGRVALVDDEDYDLVMQYKWHVVEKLPTATTRGAGPYAQANCRDRADRTTILMHCLIMGAVGIDHEDHDGLNNQRHNLRPATYVQNGANQRPQRAARSQYKGVYWDNDKRKWYAQIGVDGRSRHLGYFYSEIEAAYAYDAEARLRFGVFACPNFPDVPTRGMRDEWAVAEVVIRAERSSNRSAGRDAWWAQREMETRVCTFCGEGYQTKCARPTLYCGGRCKTAAGRRNRKERELEGRLF